MASDFVKDDGPAAPAFPFTTRARSSFRSIIMRVARGYLTLDDVWLLAPVLGMMAWLASAPVGPEDFWWHLRTGQIIAQTGQIPNTDLFTFSRAGLPWTNQAWLAQLVF